jgi:hypothetical protein
MKIVFIVMVIVLCASAVFAQDEAASPDPTIPKDQTDPAVARAMAACGPDKVKFDVTSTAGGGPVAMPDGKALVYMVEEALANCDTNCSATVKVGLDGSWIGANHGASYFSFPVSPGEHHLCLRWQSRFWARNHLVALANFRAEEGKIYYFRIRAYATESLGSQMDLDPINSDQGEFFVASYPLSIAHPKPGRNRGSTP